MTVSGLIYLYKIQEYAWGQGTERRGTVGAGSMLGKYTTRAVKSSNRPEAICIYKTISNKQIDIHECTKTISTSNI